MKAAEAIIEILKREGTECVIGYPVNHLLEIAARWDIRPIIVRQERVGLHMADAMSRLTSGKNVGVFAMQQAPGASGHSIDSKRSSSRHGSPPSTSASTERPRMPRCSV